MSLQSILRREIPAEVKVIDAGTGIVEYVASDESIDSYGEIIRANGWRFDRFSRNAPFVDSHRYDAIDCVLGKVVDFRVEGRRLIEVVQWAIDVPSNQRARMGWEMTQAGFLKAVSVGFQPIQMVSRWDQDKTGWLAQLSQLGIHEEDGVRAIYVTQQQLELSAVVIGANANALVTMSKAFRAGVLRESDIEFAAKTISDSAPRGEEPAEIASAAHVLGQAAQARAQEREAFLRQLRTACGLE